MTERTEVSADGKSRRQMIDEYQASHSDEPYRREHITTENEQCWCGPQIEHVPADDAWLTRAVDRLTELGFFIAEPGMKVEIVPDDEQGFEDDGLESHKWTGEPQHPESTRITDQEEHMHYTDRATRLCAEGDHDSAVMWDRDAERVKVREAERRFQDRAHWSDTIRSENVEATMAEEPIEHRLMRAWMNGFREGAERAQLGERWDRL